MLARLNQFIKATLMGGLVVILPSIVLINILLWVAGIVQGVTGPLVNVFIADVGIGYAWAQTIVIVICIAICFSLGMVVRNRLGAFIINTAEKNILERVPGYSTIKELIGYFLASDKKSAFSRPALIQAAEGGVWLTGFIVEELENDFFTCFVPTAPNPSSGFVLHVKGDRVRPLGDNGGEVFKTIIACGAGSNAIFNDELAETVKKDTQHV